MVSPDVTVDVKLLSIARTIELILRANESKPGCLWILQQHMVAGSDISNRRYLPTAVAVYQVVLKFTRAVRPTAAGTSHRQ